MLSTRVGAALAVTAVAVAGVTWWVRPWDSGGFCTASNRAQWVAALHRHPLSRATESDETLYPLVRGGQLHRLPHELQLWESRGPHRRLLVAPRGERIGTVQVGGGWVAAPLVRDLPHGFYRVEALVAVRLRDGHSVTVARRRPGNALGPPWLFDGSVWWSDRTKDGRAAHRLDLATGARTVPSTTTHLGQKLIAGRLGVSWEGGDAVSRQLPLPGPVEKALPRHPEPFSRRTGRRTPGTTGRASGGGVRAHRSRSRRTRTTTPGSRRISPAPSSPSSAAAKP